MDAQIWRASTSFDSRWLHENGEKNQMDGQDGQGFAIEITAIRPVQHNQTSFHFQ